ncbi:hypothetical protein CBS101457_006533 [Exobasidium rhododendri]|nr:hypothetical protein CBS101457_006533 [Exobasidium rhododendri]
MPSTTIPSHPRGAEDDINIASTSNLSAPAKKKTARFASEELETSMQPPLLVPSPGAGAKLSPAESTNGLLDPATVAKDPTVFTPEGRLVFLRSDGDADYRPPNVEIPGSSESQVNYFHIFNRKDLRWQSWSKSIAQKLAVDYFHLPPQAPNKRDWELQDFPTDYYMTEQRKGPKKGYRTDPYLFGSTAHRFRSTMEFLPHAYWLLCDPTLNMANCRCKYCTPGGRGSGGGGGSATGSSSLQPKRVGRPPGRLQPQPASKATAYRGSKANYKIRAQPSPRGHQLPGVPLAIQSNKERNDELEVVETKSFGPCEGFRIGEMAYYLLREPIISEVDPKYQITYWPVKIEGVGFRSIVNREEQDSHDRDAFTLQGRVRQKRIYEVVFLPTHEEAKVDQDRLIPGLLFQRPANLREVKLGDRKDHPWIDDKTTPELNLENGKARPKFQQILFCFLYSLETLQSLRLFYTATDRFNRTEMGRKPVSNLVNADASEKVPPWLTASNVNGDATATTTTTFAEKAVDNGGANRFLQSTVQSNYMDLDNDDSSNRRRGASVRHNAASASTLQSMTADQSVSALDLNTYWQGLLFGLERVWVGDLVRLRLSAEDVETMMSSLAKGNDLYNAEDRTRVDIASPYVLRIKAIYRLAKAEVLETDDKIRVAGDVFRVIDLNEAAKDAPSVTDKGSEIVIKPEGQVSDQANEVEFIKEVSGRAVGASSSTKRSTFEVPFRPFLEKAYEDRLPMTPTLPKGFGFQRVNQSSVEVVCSVQQLAGRLWCSFAREGDDAMTRIERKEPFLAHEDSKNEMRIRLSLTGVLPGAIKAMEVDTNQGHIVKRDRAVGNASTLAFTKTISLVERGGEGGEEEQQQQQQQQNEKPGEESIMEQEDGHKGLNDDDVDSVEGQRAVKRARLEGELQEAGVQKASDAAGRNNGVASAIPSLATSTSETMDTSSQSKVQQEGNFAKEPSPPLPEFWIKKTSRNGQGSYYANTKTKQTTWDRPVVE